MRIWLDDNGLSTQELPGASSYTISDYEVMKLIEEQTKDELLARIRATSLQSFGECASIVMESLKWTNKNFERKTGFSYKNSSRFKTLSKKWSPDLVLSFCRASEVSAEVAKCLFAAANLPLDPKLRADHHVIVDLLEKHGGESVDYWNAHLKEKGVHWIKVRELTQ